MANETSKTNNMPTHMTEAAINSVIVAINTQNDAESAFFGIDFVCD